jgi:hypothetical protein
VRSSAVLAPGSPLAAVQPVPRPAPPENRCRTHSAPREGRAWTLADENYRTCSACLDRMREALTEIRGRWDALDPTPGAAGDGQRGAPGFESRPPAGLTVIAVRDPRSSREARTWRGADGRLHREHERPPLSVLGELYTLAHHVAQARGEAVPVPVVSELTRWLDARLDWVTRQPGVVAFARVLRELVAQLRPLTGEPGAKRIGTCPNTVDEGESTRECGAPLFAPLKGDEITCRACARRWPREEWLQLGRTLRVVA